MEAKSIAAKIQLLGNLMELHGENSFKVRSYQNAYLSLKKLGSGLDNIAPEDLAKLPGIGKSVVSSIEELRSTGSTAALDKLVANTPAGVIELLQIKGLGPKRVETLWKVLGITDVGILINECTENRLAEARGFGYKTQQDLLEKAKLYQQSQGSLLYADAAAYYDRLKEELDHSTGEGNYAPTGAFYRKYQVIEQVDIIALADKWKAPDGLELEPAAGGELSGKYKGILPVEIRLVGAELAKYAFLDSFTQEARATLELDTRKLQGSDEQTLFKSAGLPYIIPEMRWDSDATATDPDTLVSRDDIKGLIHFHTTWSDGINTLEEMLNAAVGGGFSYACVTDHSKSAGYAGGLSEERVLMQQVEADALQPKYKNLTILKGIESDILTDGSLDYPPDLLATFDVVIGSIHSVLNMDKDRATQRLIKAIENPYMHMLGHSSGRLLLTRAGYPVDYDKVFDACAANMVAIEINANPRRLDLDFSLIRRATERGILISINPDAHSIQGIADLTYGCIAARAGGLQTSQTLNALSVTEFLKKLKK